MSIRMLGNTYKLGKKASKQFCQKMKIHNNGSNNPNSKLTDNEVNKIILLLKSGISYAKLAKQFHVGKSTICRINNGKRNYKPSTL